MLASQSQQLDGLKFPPFWRPEQAASNQVALREEKTVVERLLLFVPFYIVGPLVYLPFRTLLA